MNAARLTAATTVAQALSADSGIASTLISKGTACVGCYLARFCTLQDASTNYGFNWDAFIGELRDSVSSNQENQGEKDA